MEKHILVQGQKIHYHTFGSGKEALLAFHGFGQSGKDFEIFEKSLGKKFTIYSFDLFHHGKSIFEGKPVSEEELRQLFQDLMEQEGFKRFSLVGFSLGGKVVFKAMELFEDKIDHAFLLAPDGMKINRFYQFVAFTQLGAWMYGSVIRYPNFFHGILNLLRKTGLVGEKLYQFLVNQMSTDHKRKLVLKSWVTFREINPDLRNIQRIINERKIDFHLLIGKRDRVIPLRFAKKLMRGIQNKNVLHLVDTGHTMISHKIGKYLLGLT